MTLVTPHRIVSALLGKGGRKLGMIGFHNILGAWDMTFHAQFRLFMKVPVVRFFVLMTLDTIVVGEKFEGVLHHFLLSFWFDPVTINTADFFMFTIKLEIAML